MKPMSSIYKVRVGKQGRLVLPKEVRDAYEMEAGDEVTIIVKEGELTIHLHKAPEDPLEDLAQLSETISIGLSAKELKERADKERIKGRP
jgi:AbrB family looped-hinge helix DNA binding protein